MFAAALAEERASLKDQGQAVPTAGSSGYAAFKSEVVNLLVQQAELGIAAKKYGITVSQAEVAKQLAQLKKSQFGGSEKAYLAGIKQQGFTDTMVRGFLKENVLETKLFKKVTKGATARKSDIDAYYAANLAQYQTPATRAVQEILVKNNEKLANQIYTQLQGGASFATLAKKYSKDPGSADKGGNFTATQGSDVPEFDAAVFAPIRKDRRTPEAREDEAVRLVRDQADRCDHSREDDAQGKSRSGDQDASSVAEAAAGRSRLGEGPGQVLLLRREDQHIRRVTRRRPIRARPSTLPTRRPRNPLRVALAEALVELQRLTERLRLECPWDREQTERTIVPHTIEEAYEVADAALAGDDAKLLDELGDLLFQSYFLALLLSERGAGDLETVARNVTEKLIARHPHVFGDVEAETAGRVRENWERLKVEQEGREGVFHDVPETLPALLQARKVQRRAAAVGFDWLDLAGPLAKLDEELGELRAELSRAGEPTPETEPDPAVMAEIGDVLFTVVNAARRLNVDPELALRGTSSRFVERIERAEKLAAADGKEWRSLELEAQDGYYQKAKEEVR